MHLVEEIANKLEYVQFPWLELEEEKEKLHGHIKNLVQEFCTTRNSALVLERWFSDLGISWVLSIVTDDEASSASVFRQQQQLGHLARSWIVALNVIQVCVFTYLDGSCNREEGTFSPCASEFARFLQSTVSKMLPFVDAVIAPNVGPPRIQDTLSNSSDGEATTEPTTEEKLQALIGVRDALSAASEQIQLWPHCPPFLGSRDIIAEMSNLLSAKLDKLDQTILDTVDEIRTSITSLLLDSHEADSMDCEAVQGSPNIHKVTRFIVNCIKVLSTNYALVRQIVSNAASLGKYVAEHGKASPLATNTDPFAALIMEMISCLQEKLLRVSQPFPDQGLRFLFFLNNTYFMWQQLHPSSALEPHMSALTCKIDEHIQSYLQVSWAPVLSCLHDPTPLCLGRYSPLAKFQLEFQKTSTVQKLWMVPDPELRGRLRKAIIEKVSSGFTKYLEDYNVNSPRARGDVARAI
jgi:hypothetical protein